MTITYDARCRRKFWCRRFIDSQREWQLPAMLITGNVLIRSGVSVLL